MIEDRIYEYLKDKKVLILGFGREGKSTYSLIRRHNEKMKLGISDLNPITDIDVLSDKNVKIYTGENYLDACSKYDIIIKGPGVIIKDMLSDKIKEKITCQTDLFVEFCPNKTIGITGTKGKSTTSSLMYHILKSTNKRAILMGNIGIPCFDTIDLINDDTICVIELGCHQLEYMKHSPNIGVILNIYEEHLDHYVSINEYINAKKNIFKYQNPEDYILLGKGDYLDGNKENTNSKKLVFEKNFNLDKDYLYINDIKIDKNNIITKLKGEHNYFNILVCLTIYNLLGYDVNEAVKTLSTFNGLPHRLEYVGEYNEVKYYDDSIATSIPSVICAVDTLKDVDTIIIGGMDRGLDYTNLVNYLNTSNVTNIMLLPSTNTRIYEMFKNLNTQKNIVICSNMEEAVKKSKELTKKGSSCLLSPAAASYGFYKNFEERGNHFQKLVKE